MKTLAELVGMAFALSIGIGLMAGAVLLAVLIVRWLGAADAFKRIAVRQRRGVLSIQPRKNGKST